MYRAKEDGRGNSCIKTIANPRKIYKYKHAHYPVYLRGYYSVDENAVRVDGWSHPTSSISRIRINHYFTKSKEEWIARRSIGKADQRNRKDIRTLEEFYLHDNNDIYDDIMLSYVDVLRKNE